MTQSEAQKFTASVLFDAMRKHMIEEDRLYDVLNTLSLSENGYYHWTYDDYDESLELYGIAPDVRLTDEDITACKNAGFSIVWLNHTDNWETMYSLHRGTCQRTDRKHPRWPDNADSFEVSLRKQLAIQLELCKCAEARAEILSQTLSWE